MNLQEYKQTGMIELTEEDANDPGTMLVVTNLVDKQMQQWDRETNELSQLYFISKHWAAAVVYLRTRSRWTQALEDQLIEMARNGEELPNMFEWPPEFWKKVDEKNDD